MQVKGDRATNTVNIRVVGDTGGVSDEEVIQHLESACRTSRARRRIGNIFPIIDPDGFGCGVRMRKYLDGRCELQIRDSLKHKGFQCV